jgi:hypothetical protein
MKPPAIGYLRSDVSGQRQQWDETQIRRLAKRFGYDLAKIVVFGAHTDDPTQRLINVVQSTSAEAVFVPSIAHLGGEVPAKLVAVTEVNTVSPEETYAR